MAIFGKVSRQNRLDSMSRQDAAVRMPTGLGETVRTSFKESVGNALSVSIGIDKEAATRRLMTEAEEISGLSSKGLRTRSGAVANPRERVKLFAKEYAKFKKENPTAPDYPVTEEAIDELTRARRQERRDASAVAQAGETGFLSGATRFAGGTAGFLVDPINLLSMGIAGVGRSVLSTALRQSAIGAGSEVPIQAFVQGQRPGIGEEASAGEALFAVGSAGIGAGVLGGAVAGAGRILQRARSTRDLLEETAKLPPEFRTQEVRDAERVLEYMDQIEARNPFPDTPQGRSQHTQRLIEIYEALQSGRPISEAFDAPLSRTSRVNEKVKRGEPVSEFMERVRTTDPELFKRAELIETDIKKIQDQLNKTIEQTPEVDPALVRQAEAAALSRTQIETLQKQLDDLKKAKGDKRKIKRLENKVKKARAAALEPQVAPVRRAVALEDSTGNLRDEFDLQKQALVTEARENLAASAADKAKKQADAGTVRSLEEFDQQRAAGVREKLSPDAEKELKKQQQAAVRGKKKQEQLRKKLEQLNKQRDAILPKLNKKIAKVDPFMRTIRFNREVIEALEMPKGIKDANDLGHVVRALAMSRASRTNRSTAVGAASRAIDDIIEETPAEQQARVDTMEAQVRELSKIDDETQFKLADEEGEIRTVTAKEMVEELKEDQKLISELQSCVAGALI